MELRKIKRGQETRLPCGVVGAGKQGWTPKLAAKEAGLLVSLNEAETLLSAAFIPDAKLRELGYVRQAPKKKVPKKKMATKKKPVPKKKVDKKTTKVKKK